MIIYVVIQSTFLDIHMYLQKGLIYLLSNWASMCANIACQFATEIMLRDRYL